LAGACVVALPDAPACPRTLDMMFPKMLTMAS
jgi:hypothetical protein